MHDHHGRRAAEIGDVGEVAHAVVAGIGVEHRRDHVRGDARYDKRVTVGLGRGTGGGADDSARPAAILDKELLMECDRELVGDQATERVGGAAGRKR